ncbi:hypothetical protein M430DRAFT_36183 [Amorphotheca resinae ATCC 22711]|uniref:DUF7702 domain-containing protein n=1 Tax=Amorphotheca resinae ATCC 22711 TaxID=857342 RepID=A0A2T3AWE9_AMORE|nr:hypothetical protein M430DRAFT_36183 [Amorphotheca resinae ATCC 22711]PSS12983.1 hypothetical protein M430DRAFT_36183 [Amorphotheca resinae ATCC 22711]
MTLDYRNGVSIAEIIVYVPSLAIAVFLAVRHGFNRSAGWLFLVIFSLARIIGPCMQLATISQPRNISLYVGSAILQNVGLSPLQLATVGLLSRLLDGINNSHRTPVNSRIFKLIDMVILTALILSIIGGVHASDHLSQTGVYQPGPLNKAGTALYIVSFTAILIATIFVSVSISHAENGEKRILLAVAISLPFLFVRLIYSILSTFTRNKDFNVLTGNVTALLCLALLEEFAIVVIYEAIGLTLPKLQKNKIYQGTLQVDSADAVPYTAPYDSQYQRQQQPSKSAAVGQTALKIAKKTIIGRIVMAIIRSNRNRDVELQQQQYGR